jgi:hypothetical protein
MPNKEDNSDRVRRQLERLILEAVSRDFVPFETIVLILEDQSPVTLDTIASSMLSLIASGDIGAYLIHAEPPFHTAVTPTRDTLERYWFVITESGELELQKYQTD